MKIVAVYLCVHMWFYALHLGAGDWVFGIMKIVAVYLCVHMCFYALHLGAGDWVFRDHEDSGCLLVRPHVLLCSSSRGRRLGISDHEDSGCRLVRPHIVVFCSSSWCRRLGISDHEDSECLPVRPHVVVLCLLLGAGGELRSLFSQHMRKGYLS